LGRGTVEISGNNEHVRMQMADNRIFENQDIDEMMQQNLGWEIPVDALVYWVRGLPDPGSQAEELMLDAGGRIASLRQDGWDIQYEKYTNVGGYDVPSRMTVEREQLRLRLGINRWTLPDAT
jgi:outer membrane lipoprotein LolB